MKAISASLTAALLVSSASALQFGKGPPDPPKPEVIKGFAWKDPFEGEAIQAFQPTCLSSGKFPALEYSLHDLMRKRPKGLLPWAKGLKKFFAGREYPGSWAGWDHHLHDRSILLMEYTHVPVEVRQWIEEEARTDGEGKGLYAVFDKPKDDDDELDDIIEFPKAEEVDRSKDEDRVAIFAPGALYSILPLWVAAGSDCKEDLLDLNKYKSVPEDGKIVGWPLNQEPGEKHDMEFVIRVAALKAKEGAQPASSAAAAESSSETRDEL